MFTKLILTRFHATLITTFLAYAEVALAAHAQEVLFCADCTCRCVVYGAKPFAVNVLHCKLIRPLTASTHLIIAVLRRAPESIFAATTQATTVAF